MHMPAQYGVRERLMLRELSNNARATITELSKAARCSRVTAAKLLNRLTNELGTKFTLEIDTDKLGHMETHVIAVKFKRRPSDEFLEHVLSEEKYVRNAYITEGDFDLILYVAASSAIEYLHWEVAFAEKLADYAPIMKASEMPFVSFGYMPLDSSFVENISAEVKIDEHDKTLLRLLNENSRMSYRELAANARINEDTARYRLFRLKKSGIIKRFTIAVQRQPQAYTLAFFENWQYTKSHEQHAAVARDGWLNADREMPLLTTFQLTAPITGSFAFFAIALFNDKKEAFERVIKKHKIIYSRDSVEIKSVRILRAVKGLFPFRNTDIKSEFRVIRWE